jgi:enediyne biosynthesis protein E4
VRRLLAAGLATLVVASCGLGGDGDGKQGAAPPESGGQAATTVLRSVVTEASPPRKRRDEGFPDCPPVPATIAETGGDPYRDATARLGLLEPLKGMYAHAVAVGDVNGDRWLDVFVGTFADKDAEKYAKRGAKGPTPDRLLLGGAKGFRPGPALPLPPGRTAGAVFADLDADGDLDLVVSRNAKRRNPEDGGPTVVLRTDDGRLVASTTLATDLGGRGIGVFDYDGDGVLDLFVSGDSIARSESALFRGRPGLRFERVDARASGLPQELHGYGVSTGDVDGDGRPDLLVAGDNALFLNSGGGNFRAGPSPFAWETYGDEDIVTGVDTGDVNGDGQPDVVLAHHYGSTGDRNCQVPVRLYLGRGGGRFEDVTTQAGVPPFRTKTPHVEMVDLDNDGDLDMLATASGVNARKPVVLTNTGTKDGIPRFAATGGRTRGQYWVTAAVADFDKDGSSDVLLIENNPGKPSLLLLNQKNDNHWLDVRVNPAAFGAVVEVYRAGRLGASGALLFRRQVLAERGYAAGGPPLVHVGLGAAEKVDVRVRIPGGPVVDRRNVEADRELCVCG